MTAVAVAVAADFCYLVAAAQLESGAAAAVAAAAVSEVATVSDFCLTAVAVVEELDLYFVAVERPGIVDPVH